MADRRRLDQYMTPRWAVTAILPELGPWIRSGLVLEPSCGRGDILTAIQTYQPNAKVLGIDVDLDMAAEAQAANPRATVVCRDYLQLDLRAMNLRPALIIGNPPYSMAEEFVTKALDDVASNGAVAFLLRLAFMAGQAREDLHKRLRPDVHVFPKRPSFTDDGKTDATDYAWFVWHRARNHNVASWSTLEWRAAQAECSGGQA
jgi:predicted RNA methylase